PGVIAAWLLIFMASVRELGVSVFLMGPNAKVIAPSIVSAFASSGIELTAAMALIQTFTVIVALLILFRLTRGITRELTGATAPGSWSAISSSATARLPPSMA